MLSLRVGDKPLGGKGEREFEQPMGRLPGPNAGREEYRSAATAFLPVAIQTGVSGITSGGPDFGGDSNATDPQLRGNGCACKSRLINVSKKADARSCPLET